MQGVLACPVCTHRDTDAFAQARDAGRTLEYRVCRRCGHVYQSPRMGPDELETYYAAEYRRLQQGTPDPIERDLQAQAARAVVTVGLAGERLRGATRHLDIGSSSGALIEAFRDRFGCTGVGIEPGEAYRNYSLKRGLRVYRNREDLAKAGEAPFDVVTAMHVLEHVPEPVDALRTYRLEHMRPGSFLLVETPNLADHQAFELAHLHAFTADSLADSAGRAGFEILWTRVHGGYRSPVLRLYITVLARASTGPRGRRTFPLAALRSRLGRKIGVAKREFLTRHYPDWTWQSPERQLGADQAVSRATTRSPGLPPV